MGFMVFKILIIIFLNYISLNGRTAVKLPPPDINHRVVNPSKVIGWPSEKTPIAPNKFKVNLFANGFQIPRWIFAAPNGDIFVAEAGQTRSSNRITLLRDSNRDGKVDHREIFLSNLNRPFGMLIFKEWFYVANSDALWRYPFKNSKITGPGEKILTLPSGGHWTRNILLNKLGTKIYIAIGSSSNIAEYGIDKEVRRANILEINPDGTGEKIYASGLRNPVGLDWAPNTSTLWVTVNERDNIGDDLVPDFLTSIKEGGFYGWPYAYFGPNPDPRLNGQRADLVKKTLVPDVSLGAHSASLGLVFYQGSTFPQKYHNGAFIALHGSWNRTQLAGYKVAFVPFTDGKPTGEVEDFLTGFIANAAKSEVYGRPVGLAILNDGSLLVADDASNRIWRVSYQ